MVRSLRKQACCPIPRLPFRHYQLTKGGMKELSIAILIVGLYIGGTYFYDITGTFDWVTGGIVILLIPIFLYFIFK